MQVPLVTENAARIYILKMKQLLIPCPSHSCVMFVLDVIDLVSFLTPVLDVCLPLSMKQVLVYLHFASCLSHLYVHDPEQRQFRC